MPDDNEKYAPSVFMSDYDLPDPATVVNQPLPRGSEGGLVETVKRAVVTAIRQGVSDTGMSIEGNPIYVDLEYPMKEAQYPGVWVQFSSTSLKRAGIDHEALIKDDDGNWCPVQEWEVQGRVTLTVVALKNKDRDRIADMLIALMAFSRPPDLVLTKPHEDTKQYRALKAALADNPYIAMTLNTDVLYPIGQSVSVGVPWQPDVLAYEDGYAFDILGQFNVVFRHDGTYTLSRIDVNPEPVESMDEYHLLNRRHGTPWPRTL